MNKNVIVKITAEAPRQVIFDCFGQSWAMEYREKSDEKYFPRGIYDLMKNEWELSSNF